jgi:ABC-2 type transport system ATP-binding protein
MTTSISDPGASAERVKQHDDEDDAPIVRLQGIAKTYGSVNAVAGIDLEIRRGETIALLGPNGAGKTTTIGMLLGLIEPTAGSVEVFGVSPAEAIRESLVGAMLQDGKLMPGVHVGEFLDFVRGLHKEPLPKDELIDLAGLHGLESRRVDRLSGGQTQRVRFAMAIAGAPQLLVLDEPTAGMDVEARRDFWASMHAYAEQGRTILFATHYLEEAASSASRLVIIARGRTLVDGTVQQIQQHFGEPRVSFTVVGPGETSLFERFPGVQGCEIQGDRVTLRTRDQDATARALISSSAAWKDLEVKSNDLEDTFIALVHEGKREMQ